MKKKICLWIALLGIFLSSCTKLPVSSGELSSQPKIVKEFVEAEIIEHGDLSFHVVDLKTGEVIADHRGKNALVPASVMKIVTSGAALEVMGGNKTLETKLMFEGKIDKNGILKGDLYIQGGGDPTLGSDGIAAAPEAFLADWVKEMKKAGINSVNGDIIVLDDLFGHEGIPGKWLWEDMGTDYAPGTYGISIFDNLYTLYLSSGAPGTTPKITGTKPQMKKLIFDNHAVVSPNGKRDIYVRGVPFENKRGFYGVVPANRAEIIIKSDIPDPGLFLGQYFSDYMKKNGIKFNGKVTTARLTAKRPKNAVVLAVTESVSISEIIRVLLTRSDNHYAEHLFQLLEKVERVNVVEFWKEKGLDVDSLTMKDGSGLSRGDTLSAKLLTDILVYMNGKREFKFEELFPIAGQDGTVAKFLKETPLSGNARIKSGSMSGVQSYAGYLKKDGKKYAFAIIVNHWNGDRTDLRNEMEKLLNGLF
ncbi:D-alanyl-D-alanine carboxypeptidase/D-alanyl-D-alanine-endopeptidase [Fusobacterium sp.]|uniref:D-alanyl-D-alanine carboxypeptidase/D-alanyl-D-alanine endopeptidase n=1 Tax=Fusobacterium sp. TaxID=68766 RepID=UPI0029019FFE|nr:D-alanyl-D-alanine carboxypeptidase/D-alanyl-D-alanine-endopeptidase [Fusobacterium sp.]MDU1911818.1 D-alanyl-D-alanine carboxypeptidase/D-alanyl-D-alanine-endopeptidase [Fusobacterium sp.]